MIRNYVKQYEAWLDLDPEDIDLTPGTRKPSEKVLDQLFDDIETNNIQGVREYIACDYDPNAINKYNQTPLYYACYNNKTEIAKYLIEQGANVHVISDKQLTSFIKDIQNLLKKHGVEKKLNKNLSSENYYIEKIISALKGLKEQVQDMVNDRLSERQFSVVYINKDDDDDCAVIFSCNIADVYSSHPDEEVVYIKIKSEIRSVITFDVYDYISEQKYICYNIEDVKQSVIDIIEENIDHLW